MSNESATATQPQPLARKASRRQATLKVFAWGDPGCGKSRLGLSFPSPLVVDLEKSTELYGDEFDFLVAQPSRTHTPAKLVACIVDELERGVYPDVETLVIDPVTDYLDHLEAAVIDEMRKGGTDIANLTGLNRARAYADLKDGIRKRLDRMLALPLNIVWVARAKNEWGKNSDGKMDVIGRTFDAPDIVEYLADIVIKLNRGGVGEVKKSRLRELPATIRAVSYADISAALNTPEAESSVALARPALELDVDSPMATTAQLQRLGIESGRLFGSGDLADDAARQWMGVQVGREIASRKALTEAEAARLIRAMQAAKDSDALPEKISA